MNRFLEYTRIFLPRMLVDLVHLYCIIWKMYIRSSLINEYFHSRISSLFLIFLLKYAKTFLETCIYFVPLFLKVWFNLGLLPYEPYSNDVRQSYCSNAIPAAAFESHFYVRGMMCLFNKKNVFKIIDHGKCDFSIQVRQLYYYGFAMYIWVKKDKTL